MAHPSLFVPGTWHDTIRNAGALSCLAVGAAAERLMTGMSGLVTLAALAWLRVTRKDSGSEKPAPGAAKAEPAHQDTLTGVADRTALEEKLAGEWRRERRPNEPTALLLVAVDAFDALEQGTGKLGSDVALLTVARALARVLPRKADLLARYDAATFAVALPGTDLPGALRVAARLRWSIIRLGIAHPATASGFVSASIGMVVHHGLPEGGSTTLIAAANHALLKAQLGGADRLEYTVIEPEAEKAISLSVEGTSPETMRLPSIRAWIPDRESALHTLPN